MNFTDSTLFTYVILPILIFLARICDVSIGTLRIVYIARGKRLIAPVLGFFEVLIWVVAISQIFKHLDNVICYVAYAGGFAMGNYVGMLIEHKLAIGLQMVRVIFKHSPETLIEQLQKSGYGFTIVDGHGSNGPVKILFSVIKRKNFKEIFGWLNKYNPNAFFTVEDVQNVREATWPFSTSPSKSPYWHFFKMDRRRK